MFFLFQERQKGSGLHTWSRVGERNLLLKQEREEKLDEDADKLIYLVTGGGYGGSSCL